LPWPIGSNRDLGTIERIGRDGQLTVRMDNARSVKFYQNEMRHFDHGYAVTSHSSQGLTAQRVLVNVDTEVHPELINNRFAYVSVSRASHEAQIYTNNAAGLAQSLNYQTSKSSALNVANVPSALAQILESGQSL
jgi:ATP-dependent exoDNAse (exonuclease V) alpha subunit